ncbi:MAG: DUF366 family protein [Armatimonadetes bacterium]|nr:DUF366 family protein [Armatimonadota bacterium]
MKTLAVSRDLAYTGEQLRSLWIFRTFGVEGDAIAWFEGPCEVAGERLVDQVDASAGDCIRAARMTHFIAEHFGGDLDHAILRQRLLVCLAGEALRRQIEDLRRDGDDLFVGERKLSVSIATVSPVSALIHLGVNIDPDGAPVAACGLREFGVDPARFAEGLCVAYAEEVAGMRRARCTVRSVP